MTEIVNNGLTPTNKNKLSLTLRWRELCDPRIQSKMPFYQMLCITAHYNEYVCSEPLLTSVGKCLTKIFHERTETHKRARATNGYACTKRGRRCSWYQFLGDMSVTAAYEETSRIS